MTSNQAQADALDRLRGMVHGAMMYADEVARRWPELADDMEQVRRISLDAGKYLNSMVNEMEDAA